MNMRKITSMTMVWSLIVLIVNSVVLYVVPEGRVSYWADWRFLGLTKSDWGAQHTTVGFLFLFAGILHIYYNWKPIMAYMKNKARQLTVLTGASTAGLVLTVVVVGGTYYNVPPMSTIVEISSHFKDSAAEKYGEPPYGHAESSSLKMFTRRERLDLEKSMQLLERAGIEVGGAAETIKQIADNNGRSPQQIYELIKPAALEDESGQAAGAGAAFPDAPQSGWGKKVLSEVCSEYGINTQELIERLAQKGITARPEAAVKEIAAENGLEPMNIFEAIHEIVTKP